MEHGLGRLHVEGLKADEDVGGGHGQQDSGQVCGLVAARAVLFSSRGEGGDVARQLFRDQIGREVWCRICALFVRILLGIH